MAYANAQQNPREKLGSMLVVGGLHAAVGIGLATALTVTVLPPIEDENPEGFTVTPTIPPPDPIETKTPETTDTTRSIITAPTPNTNLTDDTDLVVAGPDDSQIEIGTIPTPPSNPVVSEPNPVATFMPTMPIPTNGPQGWISTDDYPGSELRKGIEGTARYSLVVNARGRVEDCQITASSGSSRLDRASCRYIERRARFDPALNRDQQAVSGTYAGAVTWQIPD